jgi:dipeptidyl aminopeptidase/acylaminoacyl peptidase
MTDFDLDRFLSLPRLSHLLLAPDGGHLVVTVQKPAPDGKKMRSSIWGLDPDGARAPVRLTRSAPGESVGAFARDGSLLFSSSRPDPDVSPDDKDQRDDDTTALWLLPADGGEARLLCTPSGGVESVRAATGADTVVFKAALFAGADDLGADRERQAARKKAGLEALLFEGYPIRHWDHWLAPRETHLFAAALNADGESVTEPVDITPAAGTALVETEFDIAPDGAIAVTSWRDESDLTDPRERLVAIDTRTGKQRFLTELDRFWYVQPAYSPDGRYVACVRGHSGDPDAIGDQTLFLVDVQTGDGRDLTPDLDLWPMHPVWAPDSNTIYFTADRKGHVALMRVGLTDSGAVVVDDECAWSDIQAGRDGKTIYGLNSGYDRPPRLYKVQLTHTPMKQPIRSFKELDELDVPGRVERLSATAADGQTVESWLVVPKSASAESPAPLIVWAHGGPLNSWNAWHWRWNPHVLAASGYAVLLPDPALSTGYGLDFIQRGWGRWGKEPYTDIMAAFEAATERPDLDGERTGLMGGSFGGYMANWVAGSTDRFRAIVTHASLWELRGFHGTTDYGAWWEREFGDPYSDDSRYQEESPHRLVGNIRTPMLVIHGALDYRVPISEGLRLWTDLARHGVEAKFLYFPDENHWVLKPQNARLWYSTVLAFLDQHVLGKPWRRPQLV